MKLTSSPYTNRPMRTPDLMRIVILCAIPGLLTQLYFFGWGTLIQLVIAVATAYLSEAWVLKLRKRPVIRTLKDNSALLTALLLAIALPPYLPWWMTALATLFAIVLVKHLYGGLGQNIFNPAMAGYVLLLIAFPVAMTSWQPVLSQTAQPLSILDSLHLIFTGFTSDGYSLQQARLTLDGITAATPLDTLRTDLREGLTSFESQQKAVFGHLAGKGWEWVNLAFLLGGLYLAKRNLIAWSISAGFVGSLFVCALLGYALNPDGSAPPLLHLFSGATMLGAFFIATDPVSAATTPKGRWLFGALIGGIVYAIRTWGGYPDAVAFAVLLANMSVSLIDYYTRPTTYGHGERSE